MYLNLLTMSLDPPRTSYMLPETPKPQTGNP